MYVMTVDQRGSRRGADAVPALLSDVDAGYRDRLVLPFERTAGDEVQALVEEPRVVVDLAVELVRRKVWSVGIGIGAADRPLSDSVRAGRGSAFVHARSAVERAKSAPQPVCVDGDDAAGAELAESGLWLLAVVLTRRSEHGWDAVDAMDSHETQRAAAGSLEISAQAMSRRLAVAGWPEERQGRTLAAHLLTKADKGRP